MRNFFRTTVGEQLKQRRIEQPAARFGARGTPHIMRLQEIMGIEANRSWGVCSLNEFRKV